jgi:hypothetical protein
MPGLLRARALNFVLYQAGWFCCILGAARGRPWLGAGLGLLAVLAHLALARRRRAEASLTLGALALGIVVDTVHMRMGTLTFHGGLLLPDFPPPWLLILWLQFATTLRYCLSWLAGRYALGAILGAVAGAAAYWAGVRLGAASFAWTRPWSSCASAGAGGWACPFCCSWGSGGMRAAGSTVYFSSRRGCSLWRHERKTPGEVRRAFSVGSGGGWKVWLRGQLSQTVHCHDAIVEFPVARRREKSKSKKGCMT